MRASGKPQIIKSAKGGELAPSICRAPPRTRKPNRRVGLRAKREGCTVRISAEDLTIWNEYSEVRTIKTKGQGQYDPEQADY